VIQWGLRHLDLARGTTLAAQILQSEIERLRMMGWSSIIALPAETAVPLSNAFATDSALAERFRLTRAVARDTREASAITWHSAQSVTLVVDSRAITYTHADGSFTRTDQAGAKVLITGITQFAFKGYNITGNELPSIGNTTSLANAAAWTKQLQISLQSSRSPGDTATATHKVLSARYILRNKRVTA